MRLPSSFRPLRPSVRPRTPQRSPREPESIIRGCSNQLPNGTGYEHRERTSYEHHQEHELAPGALQRQQASNTCPSGDKRRARVENHATRHSFSLRPGIDEQGFL